MDVRDRLECKRAAGESNASGPVGAAAATSLAETSSQAQALPCAAWGGS